MSFLNRKKRKIKLAFFQNTICSKVKQSK
uniref:Uncharacterized protein n=1 Tax=Arundo donax TaxID=35708 RepID=A0A0A9EH92_ARUDO